MTTSPLAVSATLPDDHGGLHAAVALGEMLKSDGALGEAIEQLTGKLAGLARGGSLENAIVVDEYTILNPEPLRFPNEFVRHKILDCIGDMSLFGRPVIGHLRVHKTGHALNHELVEKVLDGVLSNSMPPPTDTQNQNLPKVTALRQNQPNPFNPVTQIRFDLARDGHVRLEIFDVSGRHVRTLVDQNLKRQQHSVSWNGMDDAGRRVASGVYLYRLVTDDDTMTRRMVLLK